MESLILKVARFCLRFIIPFCSTTKGKKGQIFFLYNLGLLGKDWGILSGFEVNVGLSLTLTGVLWTERTDSMFLNAWVMIHTNWKKPFCFMPTVAVLGLRTTVGCPFKTVHPSTAISECLCRKRRHGKAMECARHGSALQH